MELVVLASADGHAIGTADKATVHTDNTPLHFAFSAWIIRNGQVLITRRALGKKTWPGVWTNSFCGHPGPDEANEDAVNRRAAFEVGITTELEPECILPGFAYRAVDASGIVEHEICPVYVAELPEGAELSPNPEEICEHVWIDADKLIAAADATPFAFSPWLIEELAHPELRERITR